MRPAHQNAHRQCEHAVAIQHSKTKSRSGVGQKLGDAEPYRLNGNHYLGSHGTRDGLGPRRIHPNEYEYE